MGEDEDPAGRESIPSGRLDVPTLGIIGQRAASHPLVESWAFDPSSISPRLIRVHLDANAFPEQIDAARLDVRWFTNGDHSVHYREDHESAADGYQCRRDRHPKTDAPRTHFHPPPDASSVEPSTLEPHHLTVIFTVLDWVTERVEELHEKSV